MSDDASARRAGGGRTAVPTDRTAAANYVAELSGELAALARQHRLDALGYILEMARLEAESAIKYVVGRR